MNPEAQTELDRILAIEPNAMSEAEAGFLRARRSYLSEEQKAVYADVLKEVADTAKASSAGSEEDPEDKGPKKTKK